MQACGDTLVAHITYIQMFFKQLVLSMGRIDCLQTKIGRTDFISCFLKTAASRYSIQKTDCLVRLYYNELIQYKDKLQINARSSVFHFMLHVYCFHAQ